MDPRSQQIRASAVSFSLFVGAFRFLGWLNGGAALILTAFLLGIVGGDIAAPPDLQLPLALLLGGFLATCLARCSPTWRRSACCAKATPGI